MLKKTRWLLLSLLALAPLSPVQASGRREGADEGHDVTIEWETGTSSLAGTAHGAMGTARLSPIASPGHADEAQDKKIGCSLDVTATSVQIECIAFNSLGWLGCASTNKAFIAAVSSMSSDSKITFVSDAGSNCVRIIVDNNSMYQQKVN